MLLVVKETVPKIYPLIHSAYSRRPPSSLARRLCSHLRVSNRETPWGPFSSALPYMTLSRRCTQHFVCFTLMMELWVEVWRRSFMI